MNIKIMNFSKAALKHLYYEKSYISSNIFEEKKITATHTFCNDRSRKAMWFVAEQFPTVFRWFGCCFLT